MEYYNDDFFDDYDEFDAQIEEFKESIKKGLKQEIKEKLERLEKENKELKNKVRNLNELEQDLKREISNVKNDYFKAKFGELIEKCFENEKLYTITTDVYYKNKCDECNEFGKITFEDKKGVKYTVDCDCRKARRKYVVKDCQTLLCCGSSKDRKMTFILEISTPDRWGDSSAKIQAFALGKKELEQSDSILILDNFDIQKIKKLKDRYSWGYVYFKNQEEAQKYADYLNNKEN